MTNDPDTLFGVLGCLELRDEPFDLAVGVIVLGAGIQIKVQGVAKVGVERDDAETGGGAGSVGTVGLHRVDGISRQPAGPVACKTGIEPGDVTSRGLGGEQADEEKENKIQ